MITRISRPARPEPLRVAMNEADKDWLGLPLPGTQQSRGWCLQLPAHEGTGCRPVYRRRYQERPSGGLSISAIHLPFDQLIWEKNPKTGSLLGACVIRFPRFPEERRKVIDGLIKK